MILYQNKTLAFKQICFHEWQTNKIKNEMMHLKGFIPNKMYWNWIHWTWPNSISFYDSNSTRDVFCQTDTVGMKTAGMMSRYLASMRMKINMMVMQTQRSQHCLWEHLTQCNLIVLVHFPQKTSQNHSKDRGEALFIFYTFSKYSASMH